MDVNNIKIVGFVSYRLYDVVSNGTDRWYLKKFTTETISDDIDEDQLIELLTNTDCIGRGGNWHQTVGIPAVNINGRIHLVCYSMRAWGELQSRICNRLLKKCALRKQPFNYISFAWSDFATDKMVNSYLKIIRDSQDNVGRQWLKFEYKKEDVFDVFNFLIDCSHHKIFTNFDLGDEDDLKNLKIDNRDKLETLCKDLYSSLSGKFNMDTFGNVYGLAFDLNMDISELKNDGFELQFTTPGTDRINIMLSILSEDFKIGKYGGGTEFTKKFIKEKMKIEYVDVLFLLEEIGKKSIDSHRIKEYVLSLVTP